MHKFQFYDSPIKSARKVRCPSSAHAFQFYDSPIKRTKQRDEKLKAKRGFNSMIVRLKVSFSKLEKEIST